MLRLITDFDGPIMDVSERYYRVYQYCLTQVKHPEQSVQELSKGEFWELKRDRTPEKEIGLRSGLELAQAKQFAQLRKATVHTLPYLIYDQILPGAIETLAKAQSLGIDLAVMTMRRTRELEEAFGRYPLGDFFESDRRYCLSNDYQKTTDVEDKPLLMARAVQELPPAEEVWMVGDTEADLVAAQKHQVKTIAVLSGIRNRRQLEIYQPNYIVNNLAEALDVITAVVPAMT